MLDYLEDRVPGDKDPVACDAFAQEVGAATLGVGHQYVARVVDNSTVCLLGNAIVIAAISCLHVIDWDSHPLRDDRGERRIGIAEDEKTIRPLVRQDALASGQNLGDL